MKTHTREFPENSTTSRAYELLKEGNKHFARSLKMNSSPLPLLETVQAERPFAVALSCTDCPHPLEQVFNQEPGAIFNVRIAGNVINEDVLGSIEYACKMAGTGLILVLGHTKCGAVKGACDGVELGNLTPLLKKIRPAVESTKAYGLGDHHYLFAEKAAYLNVINSMEDIMQRSNIIRELCREGKAGIVGGIFNLESGRVHFVREILPTETEDSLPAEMNG